MLIYFLKTDLWVLAIPGGATAAIMLFHLWFYVSFQKIKIRGRAPKGPKPFVSVILCAKNAGKGLLTTVHSILAQNYPDFEVIVVDDFSTDDSFTSLEDIQDHRLILARASEDTPGKKAALTTGILRARGPYLLMTDADCQPASLYWIESMVAEMISDPECEVVLGYGPMRKNTDVVAAFSRFETTWTAIQYISLAVMGKPYMGVGRNLMYKKSLWEKHRGFEKHALILSGDDDLFVSQAANSRNTRVQIHPDSFVYSDARTTWRDFFNQKARHTTTSLHYRWTHQILLAAIAGSSVLFWVSSIVFLVWQKVTWPVFAGLVLLKWSWQMVMSVSIYKKLFVSDLLRGIPIWDISLTVYHIVLSVYAPLRKKGW